MKALQVAVWALSAALYAALGYIFYVIFPLTTPGLGLVRFWPQAVIPAVFAVVFGPLVGGLGAAVGIFVADIFIHGNAVLSLSAGVTSNFVMFTILGYVSNKKFGWKIPVTIFGLISAFIVGLSYVFLEPPPYGFWYQMVAFGVVIGSYVAFALIVVLSSKWRSFATGSMLGLLSGSTIIGATVPIVIQIPLAPAGFIYFLWNFVTEIPFLLVIGPPVIKAVYRAFPSLRPTEEREKA